MTFRSNLPEQYPSSSGRGHYPPTVTGAVEWLHALGYAALSYGNVIVAERKLRPGTLALTVADNGEHRRVE